MPVRASLKRKFATEIYNSSSTAEGNFDLAFVGDTSLGDWYLNKATTSTSERLAQDPYSFFEGVAPLLEKSNLRIANLETVLYENPTSPLEGKKKYLGWDSPSRTVQTLKELGVDAVSLANNHTMDFGSEILTATISELKREGIEYFGAGKDLSTASTPKKFNVSIAGNNKRIYVLGALRYSSVLRDYGFFAGTDEPGINPLRARATLEQIRDIRTNDPQALIILFPHWGDNYKWASQNMWRRAEQFTEAGADLIIGHGAHMMQEIATFPGGTTVFSIGNFVFNSKGRYQRPGALPYSCVARIRLTPSDGVWCANMKLYPIVSDNTATNYRPRPVSSSEAESLFEELRRRSADRRKLQEQFFLEKDERGWYIAHRGALSPRLAATEKHYVDSPMAAVTEANSDRQASDQARLERGREQPRAKRRRVLNDPDRYGESSTQRSYERALERRGIDYERGEVEIRGLVRPAIKFRIGTTQYIISAARIYFGRDDWSIRGRPDAKGAAIVRRKDMTNSVLRANGFPAPEGAVFTRDQSRDAMLYYAALGPSYVEGFCIKPVNGGLGRHVYVGLKDEKRYAHAFEAVAAAYNQILVERALVGDVHRFLWVGGTVSAVRVGRPMNVVGDGISTIKELVRKKNDERYVNPTLRPYPLRLGEEELEFLHHNGYGPETIPETGFTIFLGNRSNRHAGADVIDTTDEVHASYKDQVSRAVATLPGMLVCGVDAVIEDHRQSATRHNFGIIEINTGPGIVGHEFPSRGAPRDVAGDVIELLLGME